MYETEAQWLYALHYASFLWRKTVSQIPLFGETQNENWRCGKPPLQCIPSEVDFLKLVLSSWHVHDIENTRKVRGQFGLFEQKKLCFKSHELFTRIARTCYEICDGKTHIKMARTCHEHFTNLVWALLSKNLPQLPFMVSYVELVELWWVGYMYK